MTEAKQAERIAIRGKPLTHNEWRTLGAFAEIGDARQAAYALDIDYQTLKNRLRRTYMKLDVFGVVSALRKVGWLQVPRRYTL